MKVAINGFGRIGRLVFRIMEEDPNIEVVAINDLTDAEQIAYLLKYDSNHRNYKVDEISFDENNIIVSGRKIRIFKEMDPANLPWGELGIDQVFECTWVRELDGAENDQVQEEYLPPYHQFNGITSQHGAHFILKIEHILMKPKYYDAIINGVDARSFPTVPVDYGYRDSKNFWYTRFRRPIAEPIPENKGVGLDSVKYAASRIDPEVKFTDEACAMLVKVPRVFLNTVLKGCVSWAKENKVTLITEKEMQIIQDKRNKEKK